LEAIRPKEKKVKNPWSALDDTLEGDGMQFYSGIGTTEEDFKRCSSQQKGQKLS